MKTRTSKLVELDRFAKIDLKKSNCLADLGPMDLVWVDLLLRYYYSKNQQPMKNGLAEAASGGIIVCSGEAAYFVSGQHVKAASAFLCPVASNLSLYIKSDCRVIRLRIEGHHSKPSTQ